MPADDYIVRRLSPNDLALLKTLRLEALTEDPDAFGSTYEREVNRSGDDWRRWVTRGVVFVAESTEHGSVGLVAGREIRVEGPRTAQLLAMWVRLTYRGTGAADALVLALLDWAGSEGIAIVKLDVVAGNIAATKLYVRHGFYPTGNVNERERDGALEVEMRRD